MSLPLQESKEYRKKERNRVYSKAYRAMETKCYEHGLEEEVAKARGDLFFMSCWSLSYVCVINYRAPWGPHAQASITSWCWVFFFSMRESVLGIGKHTIWHPPWNHSYQPYIAHNHPQQALPNYCDMINKMALAYLHWWVCPEMYSLMVNHQPDRSSSWTFSMREAVLGFGKHPSWHPHPTPPWNHSSQPFITNVLTHGKSPTR